MKCNLEMFRNVPVSKHEVESATRVVSLYPNKHKYIQRIAYRKLTADTSVIHDLGPLLCRIPLRLCVFARYQDLFCRIKNVESSTLG